MTVVANQLCRLHGTKVRATDTPDKNGGVKVHEQWSLDTMEVHINALIPLFSVITRYADGDNLSEYNTNMTPAPKDIAEQNAAKLQADRFKPKGAKYVVVPTLVGVDG